MLGIGTALHIRNTVDSENGEQPFPNGLTHRSLLRLQDAKGLYKLKAIHEGIDSG